MEQPPDRTRNDQHEMVKDQYDEVQSDGRYEEGMARMAVYHRYCQDPVIFQALGDVRGKSLLDLACGDGFYTRRFRAECGADPVMGIDLSPTYGAAFFENYLANPQSKLLRLAKGEASHARVMPHARD